MVWRDLGFQQDADVTLLRDGHGCLPPVTFEASAYTAFFEALRPER